MTANPLPPDDDTPEPLGIDPELIKELNASRRRSSTRQSPTARWVSCLTLIGYSRLQVTRWVLHGGCSKTGPTTV
jgi:hypothetical protein